MSGSAGDGDMPEETPFRVVLCGAARPSQWAFSARLIPHLASLTLPILLSVGAAGLARSQSAPDAALGEVPSSGEMKNDDRSASEKSDVASIPKWLVSCTNTGHGGSLACEMSQSVVASESGARLLTATVHPGDGANRATLMVTLPHGLYLPAGVVLGIDRGRRDALPVETCDATGCYLGQTIEPDFLAGLRRGTELHFYLQDLQRREIDLTLTLDGFESAFVTMRR